MRCDATGNPGNSLVFGGQWSQACGEVLEATNQATNVIFGSLADDQAQPKEAEKSQNSLNPLLRGRPLSKPNAAVRPAEYYAERQQAYAMVVDQNVRTAKGLCEVQKLWSEPGLRKFYAFKPASV
ncbi:hypothetical protein GJ744_007325 [Endocarpon pusillum]|uniref:Uncharacterized protein n=1 Tax=Endocarpon pusillum TaxID=364733 RepID=A0A8H7A7R6_9EURO|nr:hypothetical protein GJ744_007325 [Endocarpon pusillum]